MSNQDLLAKVIQFSIEKANETKRLEEENQKIEASIEETNEILSQLDDSKETGKQLKAELAKSEEDVKRKQKELIELQNSLVALLKNQQPKDTKHSSLEPIPIVINRIQDFIMKLTETAIDEKTIAVPILSIFKVNDGINSLYDLCVQKDMINETPEERTQRMTQYAQRQQAVIEKLKEKMSYSENEDGKHVDE